MALPVCRITGTIVDAQGRPRKLMRITVRVSGLGNLPADTLVDRGTVYVSTDELGSFELDVIQGAEAVLIVEDLRYHRRFIVPSQSTIDIRSIT